MGLLILLASGLALIVAAGTLWVVRGMLHPPRKTYAFALAKQLPADPTDLGLSAENATFTFRDGFATGGWRIEGQSPDGPVILLTHGWSSSRYMVLPRAALVAQFASQVVLYDMRGHGDSTAPACHMGTTEADDLLTVLDQVGAGNRPIVLFGTSMGAGISIVAAARDESDRIKAVIAEGPYRYLLTPLIAHMKRHKFPTFPFATLAWWHVRFWLGGFEGYDRALHAAKLRCPLLLLHGSRDDVCRVDMARQIAGAAPDATFVEIPEAGHSDLPSVNEAMYLEAVEALMRRVKNPPWEERTFKIDAATRQTRPAAVAQGA